MSFLKYLLFFFGFTLFLYLNNSNLTYSHIPTNNQIAIQEIIDQHNNIKVQFAYDQDKIKINTLTDLKFSVLNLKTEEHIKNFLARVVVTEGSELFGFDNITVNNGDFSVNHSFANYGSHQVILRVDTNSSIIPASFNVMIPSNQLTPSSPFLVNSDKSNLDKDNTNTKSFTTYLTIGIGVAVSIGMTIILLSILKKKK
ncbi:MAG TPA: hypothetical protein VFC05_05620 [Nitrososphaeraceae archaeon]|jgi:hypothetical protein|nr:hypothetical protein [Nitrososphaeraceae archaeon]